MAAQRFRILIFLRGCAQVGCDLSCKEITVQNNGEVFTRNPGPWQKERKARQPTVCIRHANMHSHTHTHTRTHTHTHKCVYTYIYICTYTAMDPGIPIYSYLSICLFILYVYIYTCRHICIHMCVCMRYTCAFISMQQLYSSARALYPFLIQDRAAWRDWTH